MIYFIESWFKTAILVQRVQLSSGEISKNCYQLDPICKAQEGDNPEEMR